MTELSSTLGLEGSPEGGSEGTSEGGSEGTTKGGSKGGSEDTPEAGSDDAAGPEDSIVNFWFCFALPVILKRYSLFINTKKETNTPIASI